MSVVLRKSKLKKGYSFYFDISYKSKRWTEWTKIRIRNSDTSEEKNEKIILAKKMKSERERELIVLGKGLPGEIKLKEMDFFDVYDELCLPRLRSQHIYQNIRKKIKKFNGEKNPLPILAIDKPWLASFLVFLKKEGMVSNTVHQYFAFMGTILREAMCLGYIVQNPYNLFNRHERPKLKRPKADHLSEKELNAFIQKETTKVDEQLRQMFLFSCFTGLRWSDCQRVSWNHIRNIQNNGKTEQVIILTQKKTNEEVIIPLTSSALALIESRKREKNGNVEPASPFIFPRWSIEVEKKKGWSLRGMLSIQMRKWKEAVGFERQFKFHLARHTYATWLIQNGVDLYTVSKLLGHADMSATTIYARVSDQVKLQAITKLPYIEISKQAKHKSLTRVA
ncbi:MAG: site-specific integrase [Bacteroidetes bacterium]|nr:site-specific integrase [Bacteroidota bacterium]